MFFRKRVLNYFSRECFSKHSITCSERSKVNLIKSCCLISNKKLYTQHVSAQKVKIKTQGYTESVNRFANRTHTCGELTINNVGENVQLCGWLEYQRMTNFFVLRDSYGSIQCIINDKKIDLLKKLQDLSYESVLRVSGKVLQRPKAQYNTNMKTGDVEIHIESMEILNTAKSQLPFYIRKLNKAKESLQMQYRYLALRFPELQRNLRVRSWVTMKMREYLINQCGFVDVATPTLFRKTPGGAQEFVVPTKHIGQFYSLTQSPQQFKQLLMVGGIDRYFQIAQCYRDEGARSDRQPEFTQLDLEMSFIDREGLLKLIEKLILNSWPEYLGILELPFPRLTYEEALEKYGSDCPDLRIPGKIYNISEIVIQSNENFDKSFNVYASVYSGKQEFLNKSTRESLINLSKQVFQEAKLIQLKVSDQYLPELSKIFSDSIRRNIINNLNLKIGDVLFLTYGPKSDARQLLGKVRVEFTNILESKGEVIRTSDYRFLWIYDFPLFTFNNKNQSLETTHHPFTQPHPEDMEYLFTNPLKVRGLQYDLVMNGSEIGGGSIRIHQKNLQEQILKMLNIDLKHMYYLLEALESGAPPHGGIALGLDRYISLICEASSIREVIAFPKTMDGKDLMSGAPAPISEEDKKLYHIQILNEKKIKDVQ